MRPWVGGRVGGYVSMYVARLIFKTSIKSQSSLSSVISKCRHLKTLLCYFRNFVIVFLNVACRNLTGPL